MRTQRSNGETDGLLAMQENMLDLMPDETRDMQSKKKVMHWDRQKKKYVQVRQPCSVIAVKAVALL